jgi:hypothetical protein
MNTRLRAYFKLTLFFGHYKFNHLKVSHSKYKISLKLVEIVSVKNCINKKATPFEVA